MKFCLKTSGENPYGKWFFSSLLCAAGLLVLVQLCLPPALKTQCLFYRWTGFPCFTCGATRCAEQILAGELLLAWQTQPLVFAGLLGGGGLLAYCAAAEIFRLPILYVRLENRAERLVAGGCLALLVAVNWVYLFLCS